MMKKFLLYSLTMFFSITLMAKGVTQSGCAYLYDYKTKSKRPIANVKLTVADAEPTASGADGTFTLKFSGREMGDRIAHSQQPYYQGLKVFNKTEFESWSIRKEPLRLIMCNKDEFDEVKDRYYALGCASVKKRYDQKVAALQKEAADYYQRIQELEEERERIMDDLRNSADVMARLDQSELDEQMRQVLTLYEQGEVDRAMKMLDDMRLEEKFLQTLDRKQYHEQEAEAARQDSILVLNNLRSSIDLYKGNGEWEKAGQVLKLLADKLGTYKETFAYALYCQKQNKFKDSETYYQQALAIAREQTKDNPMAYEPDVAATLNNLANQYVITHRFDESETVYKEALEIYRRLAKHNPQAYEPGVAMTLHNLALVYWTAQNFDESETIFKEALEIRRRLAKSTPQAYEPDVAATLNTLAMLYKKTQRFDDSETMYMEALEIRRRLATATPQAYESNVAGTLNDLASLYMSTQRFKESETMYKESLEILRRLAKSNPQAYEPHVAGTLNGLASLYMITKRLDESETMYKEALEIQRRLAKSNPQAYEPDVAWTLNNLASLYMITKRLNESETMYKEALEIRRRLAKSSQQAYEADVAATLNDLANLYMNTQRLDESETIYREALKIRRRLAKSNPLVYEQDMAMTLFKIGLLKLKQEQYKETILLFEETLDICRQIPINNPTQQQMYIGSLYSLQLLYPLVKNYEAAFRTGKEWLPILKKQYEANPEEKQSEYAQRLGNQSWYAIFVKQYAEAEQLAKEGLTIDSTMHLIYTNLAVALLFQGKYTEAEKIYRQYKDEMKESFLDDFKKFAEAGVIPKEREDDVEKIKKMLNEE